MKKILIVVKQTTGVEYHRMLMPHYHLYGHYKEEFEVMQCNGVTAIESPQCTDDFLQQFAAVIFSRTVDTEGQTEMILKRLRQLGVKSVVDIDDYWILPRNHVFYVQYMAQAAVQQIEASLRLCDHVITTTPQLAREAEKLNRSVTIIPNAIDPDQPQFEIKPIPSERVRFGWVGGVTHTEDVQMMAQGFSLLHNHRPLSSRYQLVLCGFNTNTIYDGYEAIFTDNGRCTSETYARIAGTDVFNYGAMYNHFDVALAPLKDTLFNSCKSQLKMIEAGFMKKALIVSEVLPYTMDIDNNCLTVRPQRQKDWFAQIKKLIYDPVLRNDLAEKLHHDMQKYHMDKVNEKRAQLYRTL